MGARCQSHTPRRARRRSVRAGLAPGVREFIISSLALDCGHTLRDAVLAYVTYGSLNAARDNAVLVGHRRASARARWPYGLAAHAGMMRRERP